MEDILDLYQQPLDEAYPVVCMDEKQYQLLDHLRAPIPMKPGERKSMTVTMPEKEPVASFFLPNRWPAGVKQQLASVEPRSIGLIRFENSWMFILQTLKRCFW